jgi:hypothetical protein
VYRNFAVVPFRLSFWDQFGNEIGVGGRLSVLLKVQPDKARVRKGTGFYGLDKTGKPQLSIAEEMRRRYLEFAQQKSSRAAKVSDEDDSR